MLCFEKKNQTGKKVDFSPGHYDDRKFDSIVGFGGSRVKLLDVGESLTKIQYQSEAPVVVRTLRGTPAILVRDSDQGIAIDVELRNGQKIMIGGNIFFQTKF